MQHSTHTHTPSSAQLQFAQTATVLLPDAKTHPRIRTHCPGLPHEKGDFQACAEGSSCDPSCLLNVQPSCTNTKELQRPDTHLLLGWRRRCEAVSTRVSTRFPRGWQKRLFEVV